MGHKEGPYVGDSVGRPVSTGDVVGAIVGSTVVTSVGSTVATSVGSAVGTFVGDLVGLAVGKIVGDSVSESVGLLVGGRVGGSVGVITGGSVSCSPGHPCVAIRQRSLSGHQIHSGSAWHWEASVRSIQSDGLKISPLQPS